MNDVAGNKQKAIREAGVSTQPLLTLRMDEFRAAPPAEVAAGVDALALISSRRLLPLAEELEQFVKPGGTIVAYSPFLQPAADLFAHWKRKAVHAKMQEFLLRDHQVLAQRTHPVMDSQATLFSGFLVGRAFG